MIVFCQPCLDSQQLCEPWVTGHKNYLKPRSGDRVLEKHCLDGILQTDSIAAPQLVQLFQSLPQGSQSLALGLALVAAPQLT